MLSHRPGMTGDGATKRRVTVRQSDPTGKSLVLIFGSHIKPKNISRGEDAVDGKLRLTRVAEADGEDVWSWHRDAGVKFLRSKLLRDDGGKKARSPKSTE